MGKKDKREGKKDGVKSKKRKLVKKEVLVESSEIDQIAPENEAMNCGRIVAESDKSEIQTRIDNSARPQETNGVETRTKKSKKANEKKDHLSSQTGSKSYGINHTVASEVYHISSGDEDSSKGMKKWIMEYHQSRPGLKALQERIDEFMTAHEEQEEQARKEREARAAEGGWTVVVHHKGRKKTTDAESGITVASVAPAAVIDKLTKKKTKEAGPDFYRFQRREANRNEIMMLQSKFEQDKKRIQQLRAARKFRPY